MRNRCAGAKSIALGIVSVVCVVLVICVISLDRAFSALCGEVTFSQGQSADGAYGATAYEIDCGAVGDFNLKVKLTKKLESGSSTERHVLGVMGRFRASFEWPEAPATRDGDLSGGGSMYGRGNRERAEGGRVVRSQMAGAEDRIRGQMIPRLRGQPSIGSS